MQRYTAVKADAAEDDVALALVVDAELFRLEAAVRWLDSAEVRLAPAPAHRPAAGRRHRRRLGAATPPTLGPPPRCAVDDRRAASCARCRRSTARARPRCTRCATSTCRSRAASSSPIMGPSGSGKSSLLTIAGSLEDADARARCSSTARRSAAMSRKDTGAAAAPLDRLRVPGLQPARRADRGRERGHAARARRHARPATPARAALTALEQLGVARAGRALPRRPVRWRAPAGRDRPRRRRRAPPAAGRRADRRARLGQQRGRDAPAARRLPRAARPAWSSPTRRSWRRGPTGSCSCATAASSTRPARRPGPSRCSPPAPASRHERRSRSGTPGRAALGVAAVPPGVAPAGCWCSRC